MSLHRHKKMRDYPMLGGLIRVSLAAAAGEGIDGDVVLRAVLATLTERYRDRKGVDDLRAVLQFQLDNCKGDEDHLFMRP